MLAVLLWPALQALPVRAEDIGLLHYPVIDLRTGETGTLESFRGAPTVLLVFEPGCRFCARQSRILNAMLDECTNLNAVAVGVNGSRRRLLDDLEMLRPAFPAFAAGDELAYDLGEIVITPVMLVADAAGNYTLHLLGLQDRDTLGGIFNQLGGGCP